MADKQYIQIAEVYRNREHKLINTLLDTIKQFNGKQEYTIIDDIRNVIGKHLAETGRHGSMDNPQIIKGLTVPDIECRKQLLDFLEPTGDELEAYIPQYIRKNTLKPRKERSDKGKPRGKRVVKN